MSDDVPRHSVECPSTNWTPRIPLGFTVDPPCYQRHLAQWCRNDVAQMARVELTLDDAALPTTQNKSVASLATEEL